MHAFYIHANVRQQNRARGEPEQTAGVRKPKTKATVTLMEFLVIKETFDVSAQQNSFLCSLRL